MSEADLQEMIEIFERNRREIKTPEQARAHLFLLGMIDENGDLAPQYRPAECP